MCWYSVKLRATETRYFVVLYPFLFETSYNLKNSTSISYLMVDLGAKVTVRYTCN